MGSSDLDITVCEDDFDFTDDDNDFENNEKQKQDVNDNYSMNDTRCDEHLNDSATILKDFDFDEMMRNTSNDNHGDANQSNSVSDAIRILKGVHSQRSGVGEMVDVRKKDVANNSYNTQSTYYDGSQSLEPTANASQNGSAKQNDKRLGISNIESDRTGSFKGNNINEVSDKESSSHRRATSQDAINGVAHKSDLNTESAHNEEKTDNFTHVGQSRASDIVLERYLLEKKKYKEQVGSKTTVNATFSTEPEEFGAERTVYMNNNANKDRNEKDDFKYSQEQNLESTNLRGNIEILEESTGWTSTNTSLVNILNPKHDNKRLYVDTNEVFEKSAVKRLRNVDNNRQRSSNEAYVNETNNLFNMESIDNGLDLSINQSNTPKNESVQTRVSKVMPDINYASIKNNSNSNVNDRNETDFEESDCSNDTRSQNVVNITRHGETIMIAYKSQSFSRFSQELDSEDCSYKTDKIVVDKAISNNGTSKQNIADKLPNNATEADMEELYEIITDSQPELVPFKVVEELNKIKAYLNRRDKKNASADCVSDSGYKSDSQTRTSFKNAGHTSNAWLNQSAHTLMSFIVQCNLVVNTADIVDEISRTLGDLIDKLHEEEKYPSFLEEHLATVDSLLKEVYEGVLGVGNDKLMKKDGIVHRIFLLNRSSHIIKYTIEKIIAVLEDVHCKLTQEELLELSQINKFENLPYIFHVLETLIKKYIVYNKFSSQSSTQNSQDDEGVLKKSSITDIWRRKWNLSKEPEVNTNANSTKQSVLEQCSVLLNKIIVQAMDGYSLISFYALQCFNLLQN